MKNILFYKYIDVKNPEQLKEEQSKLAKSLNLLGTILIAREGINGCLSGEDSNLEKYKEALTKSKEFPNIKFKEVPTNKHTFKKLHVRVRNEIVSSGFNVNLKNKGKYIEPKQFKKLLDKNEDIILLDARNNYEVKMGKFANAIHLDLGTFRQFPLKIEELENNNKNYNKKNNNLINNFKNYNKNNIKNENINKNFDNKIIKNNNNINNLKNKKIITYCTGGVRCEKASALLKENGFENVYQLHGGILAYGKECGNAHWEGKCFVFDTRGAIDIDPNSQSEPITQCVLCHLPNAELHNCALTACDRFFTACNECLEILKGCCSKRCRGELLNKAILAEN
ncbi:MAG: rhodanese-like domain-containing protein [Nanoarchaeota archaeon]